MTSDVNWGLIIASGVVVGLLILILISGLYLLLTPPPASEPLVTPDGMLAWSRQDTAPAAQYGPVNETPSPPAWPPSST